MKNEIVKTKKPFVVMVKPVGSLCNMSCSYCYYRDKENETNAIMTEETLETYIRQSVESIDGKIINVIWHGGEPTLAGLEFYEKAVFFQKKYLKEGYSFWNNLQTNGLLLDDDWCSFLKENRFDVGISIDGNETIHNKNRKDNSGEDTYNRVVETIKRLKRHGLNPDILCTVNSLTVKEPLVIYEALRELDTGWIQFLPVVNVKDGVVCSYSVSAGEYGKFLCDIFDEWLVNDFDTVSIQFFSEMLRVATGGSAGVCWMAKKCGRAVVLEKDGSIYSCDHFVKEEYKIGNILHEHLVSIVDKRIQDSFGELKLKRLSQKCLKCEWLYICNGGCPKDRIGSIKGEDEINYLCEGYIHFFSYTEPVIKLIVPLMKQQKSSVYIKEVVRKELSEIWKDIGRNDPCPCGSGKKAKSCCWYKRV